MSTTRLLIAAVLFFSGANIASPQDGTDSQDPAHSRDHADSQDRVKQAPKDRPPVVDESAGVRVETTSLPELPEDLTSLGAATAGGKVYVYGGHTGDAHSYAAGDQSDRFYRLDLSAGDQAVWESLPGGPALQGLALVAVADDVVRIGGFTAKNAPGQPQDLHSQTSVALFDTDGEVWRDLPSLPAGRSSIDAAVMDQTVYVFGGWTLAGSPDDAVWHDTALAMDLSDPSPQWKTIAPPPFRRRAISAAAFDAKLYVVGGMTSEGEISSRVDCYDPGTDRWSVAAALPGGGMAGFGTASMAADGFLYTNTLDGFVHRLPASGDAWQTVAKVDPARFFHRIVPGGGGDLLIIGGANMQRGKFTEVERIVW